MGQGERASAATTCMYYIFHFPWDRVGELVQQRQKQPWLWNDFIYNCLPAGREFRKLVKILHDVTRKVKCVFTSFVVVINNLLCRIFIYIYYQKYIYILLLNIRHNILLNINIFLYIYLAEKKIDTSFIRGHRNSCSVMFSFAEIAKGMLNDTTAVALYQHCSLVSYWSFDQLSVG